MNLRDYQAESIDSVDAKFSEFNRLLGVAPTGSGKTIMFSALAERWSGAGERTCIIAHREELIDQAIEKLHRATGIRADREKAENFASLKSPVVVASIQTLNRRFDRWPKDHFQKIIIDEAHHALSPMYQTPLAHFKSAKVLGVTATPDRGDKRELAEYFEEVAFEINLFDLIHQGFLAPFSVKKLPLNLDLSEVHQTAGDYDENEIASIIEPYLDRIAGEIAYHASFRKVLCFLPLIATSLKFVDACRDAGLRAEHIDGNSPDRAEKLGRFENSEFDLLSNAMLLTEGYDCPAIDCIVVLRPTRVRPLYAQMVGRGTRTCAGKEDLLLLDFMWNHNRKGMEICCPANLIAKSDEERQAIAEALEAQAKAKSAGLPDDVADTLPLDLETVASGVTAQREAALRRRLEENKKKKGVFISAEEFAMSHGAPSLANYEPVMKWESEAVTPKQEIYLKRAKIDLTTVKGKGHASQLLDVVFRSQPLKLADPKTVAMCHRFPHLAAQCGIIDYNNITQGQAGRFWAAFKSSRKVKV